MPNPSDVLRQPVTWGYARVSRADIKDFIDTDDLMQQAHRSIANQIDAIRKYAEQQGQSIPPLWLPIVTDPGETSGTPWKERTGGKMLFDALQDGDHIIITKLDRGCRNIEESCQIIKTFQDRKIGFHVIHFGGGGAINLSSTMGEMMVKMLAFVGEFERKFSMERQRDGKVAAMRRGTPVNNGTGFGTYWHDKEWRYNWEWSVGKDICALHERKGYTWKRIKEWAQEQWVVWRPFRITGQLRRPTRFDVLAYFDNEAAAVRFAETEENAFVHKGFIDFVGKKCPTCKGYERILVGELEKAAKCPECKGWGRVVKPWYYTKAHHVYHYVRHFHSRRIPEYADRLKGKSPPRPLH